jgi:RNA polymerase sigma-70 factor (ECF subfamily)
MNFNPKEQKMLNGCRSGQAKYQQMFYEHFYGKMLSVCLRYAKDREEARDILQDGYLKVFSSIDHYKGEGSLEGWVRRIMVNTAINHYHKNKKHLLHTNSDNEYEEIAESANQWTETEAIQKMSYEELLALIRTLPPAYQAVFNLYVIEGYTHKEIGELLQISEGTSKSNLAKARMKLQKQLNRSSNSKNFSCCV